MYNFLLRSLYMARHSSGNVYESLMLPGICDKAAARILRFTKGCKDRTLSTSSVRLCDHSEKTNANKVTDPTKTLDDAKVSKMEEQKANKDDGGITEEQLEVKIEHSGEKPKHLKADVPKSGKESLLDLLGAMKVEVTNKRKLKNLKMKQNYEPAPNSKPAAMQSTISTFQKATVDTSSQSETLDSELVAAASAAASTLPNRSQAESELLSQLRQHETITEAQKKGDMNNLRIIIADMKIGKTFNRQKAWSTNPIRFDEDGQGYTHDRGITAELDGVRRRRNLFAGKRLNIFSPAPDQEVDSTVARPTLWDVEFAYQISLSINQMPRNQFEEMIQWTKEGKMWQYPINNEAGLEEEANVPFHEHVFLEKHLEVDFPREGSVRHFMELVVAGLSKNPYLTVQQKRDHISWFRDYFHQKEDVLKDADVFLN